MKPTQKYINENKERFLEELFDVIRIPSISALSNHKDDMNRCAEKLRDILLASGADSASVMPTQGAPVVYAQKIIDPSLATVMVYGHYDVMPVEPLDQWITPPFEPQIREGKIFARGADDDKGQGFMHIKAFETLVKTGSLACNVKFMIEGEEEIGSASLSSWCRENKELLKCDMIIVSDTSMISWDTPSITCGLRGLTYMEVEVEGPSHDLHSGLYGGAVTNPLNALSKMIASLHDDKGRVTIPGFYDKVKTYPQQIRDQIQSSPFSEQEYKKALNIDHINGEEGYFTMERTGIRPALDVNGIWGGHTGEGTKTVIPSKAFAKISMRLVPDQDSEEIAQLFENYFTSIAPKGIRVKSRFLHGGAAYVCPTDTKPYLAACKAIEQTFGKTPLPFFSGGSIPIISTFEKVLGVKSLLMGFGLGSDATHSPNENFPLENFYKGIETIVCFYNHFANNESANNE